MDLERRRRAVSGAIEIVDIYHAKQHLCDVAKALYGPGTDLADQWAKDRRAELDAGRLRALVAALRIHVETTPEARKCIHYGAACETPGACGLAQPSILLVTLLSH